MANRNPSDRSYGDRYNDRPVSRSAGASRSGAARPAGSRPANGARPSGNARPDSRYGAAPRNNPSRRPQKRRRKANDRFYGFIAIAVIVLIVLVLLIARPFGRKADKLGGNVDTGNVTTQATLDPALAAVDADATEEPSYSSLAQYLGDADAQVEALSETEMTKVTDLSINETLPSDWMNILLLGTDERTMNESARTDTMIICSINKTTGEVKLTSLMRDLNVTLDNIGKYSGDYRLNAAHYFGGANLAMKTINECFDMNIQYYVRVNFFGFRKIAQALGGITIDITEAEMNQINKNVLQQYKLAKSANIDESDQQYVKLEQYGKDVHLDGAQTLAYARIRKTDNDYERTRRQRTVLNELLKKVKELNYMEMVTLATSMMDQFKTNMEINDIFNIAMIVMNNGLGDVEGLRLPVTGTYKEEKRNDDSRLWDCDWKTNALELYNFIYE